MPEVRLIDANAVRKTLRNLPFGYTKSFAGQAALKEIENAPTIDAIPVVRCRECWRHQTANCPMFLRGGDYACHDGFCHLGAKMDVKD